MSKTDIEESKQIGAKGVLCALEGKSGVMMVFKRISTKPYVIEIDYADISSIANVEKKIDDSWIKNGNDVSDELVEYLRPLILGEVDIKYENGIPVTLHR